jgi:hypothetical protein
LQPLCWTYLPGCFWHESSVLLVLKVRRRPELSFTIKCVNISIGAVELGFSTRGGVRLQGPVTFRYSLRAWRISRELLQAVCRWRGVVVPNLSDMARCRITRRCRQALPLAGGFFVCAVSGFVNNVRRLFSRCAGGDLCTAPRVS